MVTSIYDYKHMKFQSTWIVTCYEMVWDTFFHLVSIGAMYVVDVGVGEDMAWSSVAKTHCASRYRQKGRLSNWIYSLNECRFRRADYGQDKWRARRTLRCL